MTISGLEDELALVGDQPRLLYVKMPAPDIDPRLRQMLDRIRAEGHSAYKTFTDTDELRELLLTDLSTLLAERFGGDNTDGGHDGTTQLAPSPVTALLARDDDIDAVVGLLDGVDHRLVVLTGSGGIGKTRLALAVMERCRDRWRDGTAFVDLSLIADSAMVPAAIADALGLVVQGRQDAQDTLARRLGDRNMLLVLDNFEQVSDAAPAIADLLRRAPELHLLVTSRVVMHIRGEREWRVDPLPVPREEATLAELERSPAVRLLVERVRDADPSFELTTENAAAVGELCRRLEGLPLALELAAGWLRLLTPEQMLKRLFERLESRGSLVDLPDRQQTLTDTIEWSYDLIAPECQRLLTRLSVFGAPFTAEAVEAVCGSTQFDAIEGLSTLLDNSMVSPADRARRPTWLPAARRDSTVRLGPAGECRRDVQPSRELPARRAARGRRQPGFTGAGDALARQRAGQPPGRDRLARSHWASVR